MDPKAKLEELKARLAEVNDLNSAAALLSWDQSTYMPSGGAPARGRQMATLSQIAHQKFTDPAVGKLLDDLAPYGESLPFDSDDAALIRVTHRDYERNLKVPSEFIAKITTHTSESFQVWAKSRPENNFAAVQPYLEKTLDYSRQMADFFAPYEHVADPLIDMADFGMKASSIRALFAELRAQLVPIANAVTSQPVADAAFLRGAYDRVAVTNFAREVIKRFGYDFDRGRLDETHHPFMTKFSIGDVRITTRYPEDDMADPLFSTFHETGHALYEQGINMAFEATPLGGGTSGGVHESQSRLWENIVGRSRGFWEYYYPKLQAAFPERFAKVPFDAFYRAVNKVQRSLIRTEADEVTYNLHVMIRFDLELQMLEGKLSIRDLPEAWDERYHSDLGVNAPDYRDGVLQDVHWFAGAIGGAFQGYTLGNILSAQFYSLALKAHPGIQSEIKQGEFGTLHGWLKDNIYQHGSKFTAPELIQRVVGGPISITPYIQYLRAKYGELYKI